MDLIEAAIDHLADASSDLRFAARAASPELRAWSINKAMAAITRAQDAADKAKTETPE